MDKSTIIFLLTLIVAWLLVWIVVLVKSRNNERLRVYELLLSNDLKADFIDRQTDKITELKLANTTQQETIEIQHVQIVSLIQKVKEYETRQNRKR